MNPPNNLPARRIDDADREIVARQLQLSAEQGALDLTELDQRLAVAYSAQTSTELDVLTADLPVAAAGQEPLELHTGSGARHKDGHWIVPAEITTECRSGSITLDFTQAHCAHREIALHASVGAGSLSLIVPHGWQVDVDQVRTGSGVATSKATEPRRVGSPLIRVDGKVGSGVISAHYPRPPRRSFLAWLLRRPRPLA